MGAAATPLPRSLWLRGLGENQQTCDALLEASLRWATYSSKTRLRAARELLKAERHARVQQRRKARGTLATEQRRERTKSGADDAAARGRAPVELRSQLPRAGASPCELAQEGFARLAHQATRAPWSHLMKRVQEALPARDQTRQGRDPETHQPEESRRVTSVARSWKCLQAAGHLRTSRVMLGAAR